MPVHSFRRPKWLASFHAPVFNRRGSVAGRGSRGTACQARSCAEPLEARRLMHAAHEHLDAGASAAAANPAGSVFVDAGNVNAPFTDAAGATVWGVDVHAVGGKRVRGKFAVAGTDDDALFASRRQGKAFAYNVPGVPDGTYTLSLLFVDTVKKAGKRLFHVDAEGQRLESDLDIVARAGGARTALVLAHDVTVSGGTFDLALTRVKGQAVLSGFSLVPAAGVGQPPPPEPPQPTPPQPPPPTPEPPAPTPPAPPAGLAAAAQSPSAVVLSWSDNSADETGFELSRATGTGAAPSFVPLLTLPADATGHVDVQAVQPGETYVYRVRAVNAAGASDWSEPAVTTPPAATPATPAAPSDLSAQALGPTSVEVTWTDNSSDETGFFLERSANGGAFAPLATLAAGVTRHSDTTVSPGTTYAYRVRAGNAAGASDASNEQSVATPAAPGPTDTFTEINWSTRAAGPIGRAEALRAEVGGKLYVFGGFSGNDGPVARADVYDPATDTWTRVADLPRRLTHAGVAADGNAVYFVGGYVGTGEGYRQEFGTVEVWRYDVAADAYARLPDLPAARAGGGAAVVGRALHYFAGNNAARQDVGDHVVLDLDNPDAGWSARAALPQARSHMGYAALGGLIYAIGGQTGNDEDLTTTTAVHAYDPATDAWSPRAAMPAAISHVSSSTLVTGGRILVLGGERGHNEPVADAYAYDPAADAWAALTPLPAPRFSGVAAAIGDAIYFTSGSSKTETFLGTPVR